ncbi:FixJ family two-component response regulator [Sphingomonas zeicaulis]|uniref:response regulator transcription factor n=1 Tax=Sphingomonas zeicaulis TaxID=1632740 RepID=UPI003D207091
MTRPASPAIGSHRAASGEPVVHVIDDDPSIRGAIDSLLRSVDLRTASYGSTAAFLAAEPDDAPGCLLLDVRLPRVSGLDFQAQMAAHGIRIPVIMMTAHGDIPMSVRAMRAGAVDFLTKPFRDQDLIDAIARAIEQDRRRRAEDAAHADLRRRHATLSHREREVMALVSDGRLNKQVAFELGVSEITIKLHRASAMRKMGARTLPDLVRMVERLKPD